MVFVCEVDISVSQYMECLLSSVLAHAGLSLIWILLNQDDLLGSSMFIVLFAVVRAGVVRDDVSTCDSLARRSGGLTEKRWMEPEAEKVMFSAAHVNAVDADEYPR